MARIYLQFLRALFLSRGWPIIILQIQFERKSFSPSFKTDLSLDLVLDKIYDDYKEDDSDFCTL